MYAYGFQSPHGLDWHPPTGTLWIADGGPQAVERLSTIVVESEGGSRRGRVAASYAMPQPIGGSGLVFYRGALIPEFRDNLLISGAERRGLLRIRFDGQSPPGVISVEELLLDRVGRLRAVATGPDGAIYVCTEHQLARLRPAPRL